MKNILLKILSTIYIYYQPSMNKSIHTGPCVFLSTSRLETVMVNCRSFLPCLHRHQHFLQQIPSCLRYHLLNHKRKNSWKYNLLIADSNCAIKVKFTILRFQVCTIISSQIWLEKPVFISKVLGASDSSFETYLHAIFLKDSSSYDIAGVH